MLTPPSRFLLGLWYISIGACDEIIGKVVMDVMVMVTGSIWFNMNLLGVSMPPPEDSDLGLLKGSRSMPEVEVGLAWGPGVPGLEVDLPFELVELALLCFLYLTCKQTCCIPCGLAKEGVVSRQC